MIHYHGTPITPRTILYELAGKHFCVPFASDHQVKVCHEIGQSVMLDNSAYTTWTQGIEMDWDEWAAWAEPWLDYPTTWAVLPDVIDGDEEQNDLLAHRYAHLVNCFPVWHLHESLDRLQRLVNEWERVCFGSSGSYRDVGSGPWRRRVTDAFDRIASPAGRVPWVHMLRGMSLSGDEFPFASVDSADVGRNHNRPQNTARTMADRWDAQQPPGRWVTHRQISMEVL